MATSVVTFHPVLSHLERIHPELNARIIRLQFGNGLHFGECVWKDDSTAHPRGIRIPCRFWFSDNEDWTAFETRFFYFLENEKRNLTF